MALRAMLWVLEESGVEDNGDFRLLIALADRANDDGTAAYPSVAWLAERMCRSPRSVQRGLNRLLESGLIRRGDQELVSHYRADRRPVVYDLAVPPRGVVGVTPQPPRGDISVPNGVTPGVLQTVPSLLRNETLVADSLPLAVDPIKPAPKSQRNAVVLPASWKPNEDHQQLAGNLGVDRGFELQQFRDHHIARGSKFKDWDAAFRTWLRNAAKYQSRPGMNGGRTQTERRGDGPAIER